jgi:DNA polymerase
MIKINTPFTECKWFLLCPLNRFYKNGLLDKKWIKQYCQDNWKSCIRYQMEEKGEAHSDWMLPDGSIDKRLRKFY